jgi:hypothetical protein
MFGALLCEHTAEVQSRISKIFSDIENDSSVEDTQKIEMHHEQDVQVIIKHTFIHAFQDADESTSRRPRSMSDSQIDYDLESLCSTSSAYSSELRESMLPVAEKIIDEDAESTLSTAPSTLSLGSSRHLMEQELSEDSGSSRSSVDANQYYGYNNNSMAHILRSYNVAMNNLQGPGMMGGSIQAPKVNAEDFQVTANLADHLERTAAKLREMAQAKEDVAEKENERRRAWTEATAAAEKWQANALWFSANSQSSPQVL